MEWPTKRQLVSSQSSGFQSRRDEPYKANRQVKLQNDTNAKTKRVIPKISPNIAQIYLEKRHFACAKWSKFGTSCSAAVMNSEVGPGEAGWGWI